MQIKNKLSAFYLSMITAALLLPSSSSIASCCVPDTCCTPTCSSPGLRDGFYIGIGAGYDSYKFHQNLDFSGSTSPVTHFSTDGSDRNATGWMGSLFGGYGLYFQNVYYLGAEVFVNDSAAQTTSSSTINAVDGSVPLASATSKQNIDVSYGISLLPGYKINCDTLLYLRLGYTRARFNDDETGTISNLGSFSANTTEWFNGVTYGLGIETSVAANLSVRGEYTHTNYAANTNTISSAAINGQVYSLSSKLSPSDNQFMFSLIYHIC